MYAVIDSSYTRDVLGQLMEVVVNQNLFISILNIIPTHLHVNCINKLYEVVKVLLII